MSSRWMIGIICAVSLSAVALGAQATPNPLALAPCLIGRSQLAARCGTYWVYEDRARKSGRQIPLAVIVIPARNGHSLPDPVLFISPGGPGSTNSEAAVPIALSMPFREERDIVIVDLRGTSGPNRLDCPFPADGAGTATTTTMTAATLQQSLESMFRLNQVRSCRRSLELVADLRLYTTNLIVDDLDEVRAALGLREVNLFGESWGTRAALVYLRRHPTAVRSAVLEGVVPPPYKYPLPGARGAQRALDLLLDECDHDQSCHAAFPAIRTEVDSLVKRVRAADIAVTGIDTSNGKAVPFVLSHRAFSNGLRALLYSIGAQRRLPLLLHAAAHGNFTDLLRDFSNATGRQASSVRLGFLLSVSCYEDVSRITEEDILQQTLDSFTGDLRVREQIAACAEWPRNVPAPEDSVSVRSNAPVFLLSGLEDPVTPPEWGARAAAYLPNSIHVIAHGGHVPGGRCINAMELAFVNAASAAAVDTSCVSAISVRPFVVR